MLEGIIDGWFHRKTINVIDCGCGKSYLTCTKLRFNRGEEEKVPLYRYRLFSTVIEASKKMADNLGYQLELYAMDIKDFTLENIHIVILHAAHATDMALAFGVRKFTGYNCSAMLPKGTFKPI